MRYESQAFREAKKRRIIERVKQGNPPFRSAREIKTEYDLFLALEYVVETIQYTVRLISSLNQKSINLILSQIKLEGRRWDESHHEDALEIFMETQEEIKMCTDNVIQVCDYIEQAMKGVRAFIGEDEVSIETLNELADKSASNAYKTVCAYPGKESITNDCENFDNALTCFRGIMEDINENRAENDLPLFDVVNEINLAELAEEILRKNQKGRKREL